MKSALSVFMVLVCALVAAHGSIAATYDLSGTWNWSESNFQQGGPCPATPEQSGICSITQNGDTFTLVFLSGTTCIPASLCKFPGTISGAMYTAANSAVVDNEGGIANNTLTFTASSDSAASGIGTSTFTHPDGLCTWEYDLTLTKGPPVTEEVQITTLCTDITGVVQPGQPITFTAVAVGAGAAYYKFFYRAAYGTPAYSDPRNPWVVMQDFSNANICTYAFPSPGNYIVVVRAVGDPNNYNAAEVPLSGTNVRVGGTEGDIQFNCLPTDASLATTVDVPITFSADAIGEGAIYYKFWYRAGYGTTEYATNPWMVMQEFSTANTCTHTFTAPGDYVVVVWAVKDPNNIPQDYPIIGMNVRVENQGELWGTLLRGTDGGVDGVKYKIAQLPH